MSLPSSISTDQLLRLWGELISAYYGKSGFGGDTCEIYAYTLMRYDPVIVHGKRDSDMRAEAERESWESAKQALLQVVKRFADDWKCECLIDGVSVLAYQDIGIFNHRVHIQVRS